MIWLINIGFPGRDSYVLPEKAWLPKEWAQFSQSGGNWQGIEGVGVRGLGFRLGLLGLFRVYVGFIQGLYRVYTGS